MIIILTSSNYEGLYRAQQSLAMRFDVVDDAVVAAARTTHSKNITSMVLAEDDLQNGKYPQSWGTTNKNNLNRCKIND